MKLYQKRTVNPSDAKRAIIHTILLQTLVSGLTGCLFFLVFTGFRPDFSVFSLLIALLLSVVLLLISFCSILVMSRGKISIYTLFMMLGGMLLPFAVGALLWNEHINGFRMAGIVLLTLSLFIPNLKKEKKSGSVLFFLLCGAIFILNGMMSIFSKLHQVTASHVDNSSFLVMLYGLLALFSAVLLAVLKLTGPAQKSPENKVSGKNALINYGVLVSYALVSSVSYLLQLKGASALDASLLYPMITGGSIVFTTLFGLLFFKEKITKFIAASTLLVCLSTLLFVL